ncbi:MAG: redox-sensing transcriptional repressor Rex [Dehalococcoidia bacterium]|nr:redox-sensing transcriptional repressor Rex [Dehalococcoidia bacterium]
MTTTTIPEVVVLRLPLYVRVLAALEGRGQGVVSSQELGTLLHATPAQIRKDLSYFGRFGKQGRGYQVSNLLKELRHIMGIDREWSVVLVGVGQLGSAILTYGGFAPQGFNILAAFDADPSKHGAAIGNVLVQDIAQIKSEAQRLGVHIGIVAVPVSHCQRVVDLLVDCGIRAILNYAPYQPTTPPGVWVRDIDPVVALQSMTYHLKTAEDQW